MSNVETGIFFEQMVQDLEDGNLERKSEIVNFFKNTIKMQIQLKPS